jgi:hypothetical protein
MATENWLLTFESHDTHGVLFMNTIGVHYGAAGTGAVDDATLADNMKDWLATAYRAALPGWLTLDLLRARSAPHGSGVEEIRTVGLAGSASASGDNPRELCVTLSFKTDQATRSGRGHISFPAPASETAYTAGIFSTSTAWWAALDTFINALAAGHDVGALGADGHLSHRVWSRKNQASYDVTAIIKRTQPRWVERRQTAP